MIDKNEFHANISKRDEAEPKERLHRVSPCVLEGKECCLASRRAAKLDNKQRFNSVLKVGESYFKHKAVSDNLSLKSLKEVGILVIRNFIETIPREELKKKKYKKSPTNSPKKLEEKKLVHRVVSGFDIGGDIPEFGPISPKSLKPH